MPYGERFIKFISGITKSREEAEQESWAAAADANANAQNADLRKSQTPAEAAKYPEEATKEREQQEKLERGSIVRTNTDGSTTVVAKAEKAARESERNGAKENTVPDRVVRTVRSPSAERGDMRGTTLPIVEEAGEGSSVGGRSGRSGLEENEKPPPTPSKDPKEWLTPGDTDRKPQVPPKEPSIRRSCDSNKALPALPADEVPAEEFLNRMN